MRIVLGIESSCDETAIALVREDKTVLAHCLATQRDDHAPYGGVVPEIAARAHLAQIDRLYTKTMADAKLTIDQVDAIAVTAGPGLIGGVIVGVMLAKAIAASANKPLIAINHLEGHALTVRLTTEQATFPYLLLLISGGHCQQLLVRGVGDYVRLGGTKDDALGEAFDKVAKMLGMPYPGGPELEKAARSGNPKAFAFPRPLHGTPGCDFSFSGLKTAVRLVIEKERAKRSGAPYSGDNGEMVSATFIADVAASFEAAIVHVLNDRVPNAYHRVTSDGIRPTALVVAGGVAANQTIGATLASLASGWNIPFLVAPPALCTDNGIMIAWAGMERLMAGVSDDLALEPRARWPLSELTPVAMEENEGA